METPPYSYLDIGRECRDLKSLVKKIPIYRNRHYTIYFFRENNRKYQVIVLGKPSIEYRFKRRYDMLSGLKQLLKEALIKHYNKIFIEITWNKTTYRIQVKESPLSIKILIDK